MAKNNAKAVNSGRSSLAGSPTSSRTSPNKSQDSSSPSLSPGSERERVAAVNELEILQSSPVLSGIDLSFESTSDATGASQASESGSLAPVDIHAQLRDTNGQKILLYENLPTSSVPGWIHDELLRDVCEQPHVSICAVGSSLYDAIHKYTERKDDPFYLYKIDSLEAAKTLLLDGLIDIFVTMVEKPCRDEYMLQRYAASAGTVTAVSLKTASQLLSLKVRRQK